MQKFASEDKVRKKYFAFNLMVKLLQFSEGNALNISV